MWGAERGARAQRPAAKCLRAGSLGGLLEAAAEIKAKSYQKSSNGKRLHWSQLAVVIPLSELRHELHQTLTPFCVPHPHLQSAAPPAPRAVLPTDASHTPLQRLMHAPQILPLQAFFSQNARLKSLLTVHKANNPGKTGQAVGGEESRTSQKALIKEFYISRSPITSTSGIILVMWRASPQPRSQAGHRLCLTEAALRAAKSMQISTVKDNCCGTGHPSTQPQPPALKLGAAT